MCEELKKVRIGKIQDRKKERSKHVPKKGERKHMPL